MAFIGELTTSSSFATAQLLDVRLFSISVGPGLPAAPPMFISGSICPCTDQD